MILIPRSKSTLQGYYIYVLRGGSFFSRIPLMSSSCRYRYGPLIRNDIFGFRVALRKRDK